RRRGDELAGRHRLLVLLPLLAVDAVGEGGVDDDRHVLGLVLLDEGPHRLVELGEAGRVTPLGGDVGSVDDDVVDRHGMPGVRVGDPAAASPCGAADRRVARAAATPPAPCALPGGPCRTGVPARTRARPQVASQAAELTWCARAVAARVSRDRTRPPSRRPWPAARRGWGSRT